MLNNQLLIIVRRAILLAGMIWLAYGGVNGQPASYSSLIKQYNSNVLFEENLGQYNDSIAYLCKLYDEQVRFIETGLSIALMRGTIDTAAPADLPKYRQHQWPEAGGWEALVWNLEFVGADTAGQWEPYQCLGGVQNYLRSTGSFTGVSSYAELWYEDIYPGISLRYYGAEESALKYDFVLEAGLTQATNIVVEAQGVDNMTLDAEGKLQIHTAWGVVEEAVPYAYQIIDGAEVEVAAEYVLLGSNRFGFDITGRVHPSYPVVIDPLTLNWGTFLHGSGSDDYIMAIDVDTAGNIYSTGYTQTPSFPVTPGVFQATHGGSMDVFVTKVSPGGAGLVYSTFIGGTSWEMGYGIMVDIDGKAYVSGFSRSSDLPVRGGFQMVHGGGTIDGFIAGLSESGDSLLFGTFIGGTERDYIYDMRMGDDGSLYMTGFTLSVDFPVSTDAYQGTYGGSGDGFVARVSVNGDSLLYSTYLGGTGYEICNAIILDEGTTWLVGTTSSADMPITADALQDSISYVSGYTQQDAFLVHLGADGDSLLYGTFLGGYESDEAQAISLNAAGEIIIGGMTYSVDFPTSADALMEGSHPNLGGGDLFITRLDSLGQQIQHSTYIGGSENEYCKALRMMNDDEVALLGSTRSPNFPISAGSAGYAGGYDAYVLIYQIDNGTLEENTLFGGYYNDYPRSPGSMLIEDDGELRVAVTTHSPGMPVAGSTYQSTKTNGVDDTPWIGGIEVGTVLEANLDQFEVRAVEKGAELQWSLEANNSEGEIRIQRSEESTGKWEDIATTQVWSRSQEGDYLDEDLTYGGTYHYRLSYMDLNGKQVLSPVRTLNWTARASQPALAIYPNPASARVMIEFGGPEVHNSTLRIWDTHGRLQSQVSGISTQQVELDVTNWPSGLYICQWAAPGQGSASQWVQVQ